MMYSEYKLRVLKQYNLKQKEGSLALNLMKPSPAKLKRECLIALERTKADDFKTLGDFFGPRENLAAYAQAIKRIETDKFRPLENFLKGRVQNPDDKNIELLAWLIDFPGRPFRFGAEVLEQEFIPAEIREIKKQNNPLSAVETMQIYGAGNQVASSIEIGKPPLIAKPWANTISKYKKHFIIAGIVLILGAVGFSIRSTEFGKSLPDPANSGNNCMYWTGQQYVEVACDKQMPNTLVIGLDPLRLDHFKKISRLDSISESDIGKVWYYKVQRDKVEFYSGGGTHPDYPKKQLKPMTKYMYNKYVRPYKK